MVIKGRQTRADAIYEFIIQYMTESNGIAPAVRDIAEGLGISSTSQVRYSMDRLVEQGRVTVDPRIARGIHVVGYGWGKIE